MTDIKYTGSIEGHLWMARADQKIAIFKQPSIIKGEVPFLTFHADNQVEDGKLWAKGGKLTFEGNADESAKVLFDSLKLHFDRYSEELTSDVITHLEATAKQLGLDPGGYQSLELLSDGIGHAIDSLNPQWISVEDRLPEDEGAYWCFVPKEKYINQKVYFFTPGYGFNSGYVTHWMPLPSPPKENS